MPDRAPRQAASTPARRRPHLTLHRAKFSATVACVAPAAAVASLREARTAASTKGVYRAAEPLYEAGCAAAGMQPWPPCWASLQLFAGYLRESGAFAAPSVYYAIKKYVDAIKKFNAIKNVTRGRGGGGEKNMRKA